MTSQLENVIDNRKSEIDELIKKIAASAERIADNDDADWSHAGSLTEIASRLAEIAAFAN